MQQTAAEIHINSQTVETVYMYKLAAMP